MILCGNPPSGFLEHSLKTTSEPKILTTVKKMTVYSQTVNKFKLMKFKDKKRKQEQRIF